MIGAPLRFPAGITSSLAVRHRWSVYSTCPSRPIIIYSAVPFALPGPEAIRANGVDLD